MPNKLDPNILQQLAEMQVKKGLDFAELAVLYSYTLSVQVVSQHKEFNILDAALPKTVALARKLQPEIEADLRRTSGLFAGE